MKKKNEIMETVKETVKNHRASFVSMILFIAGSAVTALLPPLVLEQGVNDIAAGQGIPFGLALAYFALILLSDLFESAQGASITIFGQKLTHRLRSKLCAKLNRIDADYFITHEGGRTASVFVNDADAIDSLYSGGVAGMAADSLKIICILAVIFTKSLGLGLLLLGVTPLLFGMTRVFQKKTLLAQQKNRKAIAKVNNHIPETIRNIRMIHVFRKEGFMEKKYDGFITESYNAVNRANAYDSIYSPIILTVQAMVIAVMMLGASKGSSYQQFFGLDVGSAVAVIAYVGKIFSPLESIGMEIQSIQSAMAGIKNIRDFLNEGETEFIHPETTEPGGHAAVLDHVNFGYNMEKQVLLDFSMDILAGENVILTGRTGAGKSTVFRLLTGLYFPQEGTVKIGNRNPAALSEDQRRKAYGLVEQKFAVLPGSVRDQITMYDASITEDAVMKALETAGLAETVRKLDHGLDTVMKEGLFSQGQLQLLSIARAVVTDPELLLLDEITANLDSATENQVLTALRKASEKRTVLSISHRYSRALADCRIIEIG